MTSATRHQHTGDHDVHVLLELGRTMLRRAYERDKGCALLNPPRMLPAMGGDSTHSRALSPVNETTSERQTRPLELEVAAKELEAFTYALAHDLRAPLRRIDGFGEALLEDFGASMQPEALEYLNAIRASAREMTGLLDDLARFGKIAAIDLEIERVDLSSVAEGLLGGLCRGSPTTGCDIEIQEAVIAEGDEALLRLLLESLLRNAWKFTSKQARRRICFGSKSCGSVQTYFVSDNGVGFDARYASKLFNAFQRLHSVSEFDGGGMGLAIARRIVHRHGGKIWAESTLGEGATFHFTLASDG